MYVPPLVLLKSTMSSLVFLLLRARLLSCAPLSQVLKFLLVGRLIIVADEANHRCVVCKLDNGVGVMYRCAVIDGGVEERAQHTALWNTGVQYEA